MTYSYCQHFFKKIFLFLKKFFENRKKPIIQAFHALEKLLLYNFIQFFSFIRYSKILWFNNSYSGENHSIYYRAFRLYTNTPIITIMKSVETSIRKNPWDSLRIPQNYSELKTLISLFHSF